MNTLINALKNPRLYDHPTSDFSVIETHISWVLLTGEYAYKIKKPVKLEFLDFSTLEKRHFYCQEELRLNKRIAATHYCDVVSIIGTPSKPAINGPFNISSPPIEYAVKMKQFPQNCQLDRMLSNSELTDEHINSLATTVSGFHEEIAISNSKDNFGTPEIIKEATDKCFDVINALITQSDDVNNLNNIQRWCDAEYNRCIEIFRQRKQQGYIKECHGDMHLGNIAFTDNKILLFDCIEFKDAFRWIDVISEVAFIVMDLEERQHPEMAFDFLNVYLEQTGDYGGVDVLRYYLVYRALVRAKVLCIRSHQGDIGKSEKQNAIFEYRRYISLATSYIQKQKNTLVITHGLSGSGKTWVSSKLLKAERMIRIRSDVERKRLFKNDVSDTSFKEQKPNPIHLYSAHTTMMTYNVLHDATHSMLSHHWSVIVDATFLQHEDRKKFQSLAKKLGVNFHILNCDAIKQTLVTRVKQRFSVGLDASDATEVILNQQYNLIEPITESEKQFTVTVNTNKLINVSNISHRLRHTKQEIESVSS